MSIVMFSEATSKNDEIENSDTNEEVVVLKKRKKGITKSD